MAVVTVEIVIGSLVIVNFVAYLVYGTPQKHSPDDLSEELIWWDVVVVGLGLSLNLYRFQSHFECVQP